MLWSEVEFKTTWYSLNKNEHHDTVSSGQLISMISMNVCQGIWNIVVELVSNKRSIYKAAHLSKFKSLKLLP